MKKRNTSSTKSLLGFSKKHSTELKQFLSLVLLITAVPLALLISYVPVRLWSRAAIQTSHIYFNPTNGTMPPNGALKVMLDSKGESIGFAKVVISFDPSKVQLANEVQTTASLRMDNNGSNPAPVAPYCQGTEPCIARTRMSDANATGKIVLALGVKPGDVAPAGVFELATLSLKPMTTNANESATITVDTVASQVVNMSAEKQNLSSQASTYSLNQSLGNANPTNNLSGSQQPASGSKVLYAEDDASVKESTPTTNNGKATSLVIDMAPDPVEYSYLRFYLTSVTEKPTKATLRLYVTNGSTKAHGVNAVADSWNESTITFDNRPVLGASIGSTPSVGDNQWVEVDVTSYVNANIGKNASLALKAQDTDGIHFHSSENTNKPQLVLTY